MADAAAGRRAQVRVGDRLPDLTSEPISRTTLALFAGASNDHMPLHIDSDYAQAAGMDDVFAHGMLSMAYMGRLITSWSPSESLLSWNVRFLAITPLHARVICSGEVTAIERQAGRDVAILHLSARTDSDVPTLVGDAVVAIS